MKPTVAPFVPLFESKVQKYSQELRVMQDSQIRDELMARQKAHSASVVNPVDELDRLENEAMFNCVIQEILKRKTLERELEDIEWLLC